MLWECEAFIEMLDIVNTINEVLDSILRKTEVDPSSRRHRTKSALSWSFCDNSRQQTCLRMNKSCLK